MSNGYTSPLLHFVNKNATSPGSGWLAMVAVGAGVGLIGCYAAAGYLGLAGNEKWVFVGLGAMLGGVAGYGVSCSFSLGDLVLIGFLAAGLLGAYLFLKDTTGLVVAAAPAIVSAVPMMAA